MRRAACCLLLCAFAARAAEPPPPEPTWSVRVHLLSDDARVELHRAAARRGPPICAAPCDADVQFRSGDLFTLGGRGLASSDEFTFRPRDGDVTLQVRPAPQAPRTAGKGLIIGGVLLLVAGGVVASASTANCSANFGSNCNATTGANVGAGIYLGGAVAILVGVLVLVSSRTTELSVVP